jgi:adsorption protein B
MSILAMPINGVARVCVILACAGILIGGIDDLALDLVYWLNHLRRRSVPRVRNLAPSCNRRFAIFVAGLGRSRGHWRPAGDHHYAVR